MRSVKALTGKWHAWNPRGINKISSSVSGIEITYFLLDGDRRLDEVRNDNLLALRDYSIEHGYFEYDISFGGAIVGVRIAASEECVVVEFSPVLGRDRLLVGASATGFSSESVCSRKKGERLSLQPIDGPKSDLWFTWGDAAVDERSLLAPLKEVTYLVFAAESGYDVPNSDAAARDFVDRRCSAYLASYADSNQELARARRLCASASNMDVIYIPERNEIVCSSSRAWSVGPIWGGFCYFTWDALLCSPMLAEESKDIAQANVLTALSQSGSSGILYGGVGKYYTSKDRSLPPVESFTVLELYRRFGDDDFLAACYPALRRSLVFYIENCDGNGDGLFEWYSFPADLEPGEKEMIEKINRLLPLGDGSCTLQGAKYSSGLDNHPSFDDAEYDEATHTMNAADIGLNSLLVHKSECLAEIAGILGHEDDRRQYLEISTNLRRLIQDNLWDEHSGIYKSRRWNGEFVEALGPMNFYPLLAGIPTSEQARRMVDEHLLNEDEFWGEYILPTVAKNHPSFHDQDYWRGRIWGPTNYLVYRGLKRCGFDDVAAEFAAKSASLFLREYEKDSHIHENYNAITGSGDDANVEQGKLGSDAYYPWGALLLYLMVEESGARNDHKQTTC